MSEGDLVDPPEERDHQPIPLARMLRDEFEVIHGKTDGLAKDCTVEEVQTAHLKAKSAALCLSGGGIRSAAFSLGVVQGLAKCGLLHQFHFLSTVSGGGYTGGMISAWAYREGKSIEAVEKGLSGSLPIGGDGVKHDPIAWVRRYSNYLMPRMGMLSLDSWALIATYLRNLLVNWLVLVPALSFIACLPILIFRILNANVLRQGWRAEMIAFSGLSLSYFGVLVLRWRSFSPVEPGGFYPFPRFDLIVRWFVGVGSLLLTMGFFVKAHDPSTLLPHILQPFWWVMVACEAVWSLPWLLKWLGRTRRMPLHQLVAVRFASVFSSLAFIASLALWVRLMRGMTGLPMPDPEQGVLRFVAILGPSAFIGCVLLGEIVFVGLTASVSNDQDREWWARTVGAVLRVSLAWICAGSVVLFGSRAIMLISQATRSMSEAIAERIPGIATMAALGISALLAHQFFRGTTNTRSGMLGKHKAAAARFFGLNFVAVVMITMLFAGLGYYLTRFSELTPGLVRILPPVLVPAGLTEGDSKLISFLGFAGLLFVAAGVFGKTVHVNRFSLHAMYRERLARTFLAASRWQRRGAIESAASQAPIQGNTQLQAWQQLYVKAISLYQTLSGKPPVSDEIQYNERHPDKFTQFDPDDNPLFTWMSPLSVATPVAGESPRGERQPLLVVNCALNLVGDLDSSVSERKAASFIFTPLHAGSERTGYRKTSEYGGPDGVSLGTAITISGAAVSPNAGQRSTPAMTFLMTMFNTRLGWWLGNPESADSAKYGATGPSQSLRPLLDELLGRTRSTEDWVHLSDGGHFENLGLYEMVRRGCKFIVVVDASADPDRELGDLVNAFRKIRIDLGTAFKQVETFSIGDRNLGKAGRYAARFDIAYPDGGAGHLLYVKTAYYDTDPYEAPKYVIDYANKSPEFPHESTTDQFYLETQFECYRALGEHEIETIAAKQGTLPGLFAMANQHIRG